MKSMESPPGTGVGSVPDIGIACCHFSLSQSFPALRSSVLQTTLETVLAKVASRPHFSRSFSAQTILGAAQAKVETTPSHPLFPLCRSIVPIFCCFIGEALCKNV